MALSRAIGAGDGTAAVPASGHVPRPFDGAVEVIDTSAWSGVRIDEPVEGGHRNEVWSGRRGDERVAVRTSRRSPASLDWELDLLVELDRAGFVVPTPIPTDEGDRSSDGVVVQRWIDGREPTSTDDWHLVADELRRVHRLSAGHVQRPDCHTILELDRGGRGVDADLSVLSDADAAMVLDTFAAMHDVPVSTIHGDPGPSNLRITADGRVGLLDWDESRVDVVHLDLANLGTQVLGDADHERALRCADAWGAANAWIAEPEYARRRLEALRRRSSG